ncbi:HNH endonuclease family protein [Streptomyces sp. WM6378]|uniref:HNH endonuclease family protein n=1 Tax=Streptomyces sp. WM6378 TaxID=1415557 RepID=UPI000AD292C3|nr:HNH endonuclease family protein [Streptomyces sp. WM6378]
MSGTWHSEYDGKTLTASGQVDIDHMVPLAASWRAGADLWDTAKRKAFANDLEHSQLIAISAASNRSKGDRTPDLWKPPLRSPTGALTPRLDRREAPLPTQRHRDREGGARRDARHLPGQLMPAPEPAVCDDQVTAGPGGAMTDQVGVITGDLTIHTTRRADHLVAIAIQYTGADEWYALTGSPVAVPDGELEAYHERVLGAVEHGAEAVAPT